VTASLAPSEPRKLTLYDVGMEGIIIADILTESEGELTPELEARLDELMRKGPDKIEAAARVLRQIESDAAACDAEAARLKGRKEMFERQAQNLKARMVFAVDAAFSGKVKTALFTIWTQKARDTVAVSLAEGFTVDIVRADHPELVKTEYQLDKAAALRIWEEHAEQIKLAREALADPEAPEAAKRHATELLKLIPECLYIEEKIGNRYLRVK
jgi:hypothetical protein